MNTHALLIFSGGQDSGTCLAWALQNFSHVTTLGFAYGQRHDVEMACRPVLRQAVAALLPGGKEKLGEDFVLYTDFFQQIEATALTATLPLQQNVQGLPNTFVPGRNLIFLNLAAAWAYSRPLRHIVMGVCETDSSGYPDCRDDSVKAMQVALNAGMDTRFVIHTPLMWRSKGQTWDMALELGGEALVQALLEHSHSCYLGQRSQRHSWGYGCGQCPACVLRVRGYEDYLQRKGHDA